MYGIKYVRDIMYVRCARPPLHTYFTIYHIFFCFNFQVNGIKGGRDRRRKAAYTPLICQFLRNPTACRPLGHIRFGQANKWSSAEMAGAETRLAAVFFASNPKNWDGGKVLVDLIED